MDRTTRKEEIVLQREKEIEIKNKCQRKKKEESKGQL